MKQCLPKLLLFLFFITGFRSHSQTVNVPYQFYLDANNNCNYDGGETLLYNLPGTINFTYVTSSATTVNTSTTATCIDLLTISNPSVPANNTLSYVNFPTSYPTFSLNSSCGAYTNLSYTATNYLPVKSNNQMSDFKWNGLSAYVKGNTFPVCFNIGNDSMSIGFNIDNSYTFNTMNASRTYSLYLDGVIYDQIFVNSTWGYSVVSGTRASVYELYFSWSTMINIRTQIPAGISTLGTHTFAIKSSNLYGSPLSVINYSCNLNSVPCTKVSGKFFNDCNFDCLLNTGDGIFNQGVVAQVYSSMGQIALFQPSIYGDFSLFFPTINTSYITSYTVVPTVTACPNVTITIPPGVTTSSISLGHNFSGNISNPGTYCHPAQFAANKPNPGSILSIFIKVDDYLSYASCTGTSSINPGKLKLKLPQGFTYSSVGVSTPAPDNFISGPFGDTIVWNVPDFAAINAVYDLSVSIASTLTVGNSFSVTSFIYPLFDVDLSNNNNTFTGIVGGPLDPNNKECYAAGIQANGDIPFGVQDLFYTINFQNIGTAPAQNVITLDTLDTNLDWSTLQVLNSSFPVRTQVDNVSGATFFYFKGINLPDSTSNEPGSHGYVQYKIKLKPGVPVNTIIKNRAHNYFDFQPPVPTNQTKNKLVILAGINELEKEKLVLISPNPSSDKVNISAKEIIQTISVLNNLGQIVMKQDVNSIQSQTDLSQITDGIYFINLQFRDGSKVTRKVIKN